MDNVWSLFNVCIYCISVTSRWFRASRCINYYCYYYYCYTTTQKSVSCWMCPPCNIYSTFHLVHAVLGVLVGPQKEVLTGNRPICFALPRHSGRVFVVLIKTYFLFFFFSSFPNHNIGCVVIVGVLVEYSPCTPRLYTWTCALNTCSWQTFIQAYTHSPTVESILRLKTTVSLLSAGLTCSDEHLFDDGWIMGAVCFGE